MKAIRLPDGNLRVPVPDENVIGAVPYKTVTPDDPEYKLWELHAREVRTEDED